MAALWYLLNPQMFAGWLREWIKMWLRELVSAVETELQLAVRTVEMIMTAMCPHYKWVAARTELNPSSFSYFVVFLKQCFFRYHHHWILQLNVLHSTERTVLIKHSQLMIALITQLKFTTLRLGTELELVTNSAYSFNLLLFEVLTPSVLNHQLELRALHIMWHCERS